MEPTLLERKAKKSSAFTTPPSGRIDDAARREANFKVVSVRNDAGRLEGIVMGKRDFLSCLEKRDLMSQTAASSETLLRWAERYEQEGRVADAIDFYTKAGARDALSRLLDRAREEGDLFLMRRLHQALGSVAQTEEWLALARKAEELGKFAFAVEAYRLGGAVEDMERLTLSSK